MVINFITSFVVSATCIAFAQQANYQYDALSRLTRVAYSDGTSIVYTYDAGGNRVSQVISNPSISLPRVGVDKSTLTFSAATGQTSGSQAIAVTNAGGGSLQWDAIATASWLSVTPASGTNSGAVNVTASAAGMSAGTYNANVMILASAANPSVTIPVTFTVITAQGSPSITSGGIVSAAGSSPGIARGSIASLYGNSLANGPSQATSTPLPRTLGNTQVVVNGVSAPLWYADAGQINFQVPFEAPLQGLATVVVTRGAAASSPMNIVLAPYAPSVFTYQRSSGVLDPIIVHSAGNQLVTPTNPAVPGEYLVVYGTGLGDLTVLPATDAPSPTSPPAAAKVTPTATIGGVNAPVAFAGLTPGGIGLAQFNVQVPNNLPSGSSLPLVINFNGSASSPVNVALKNSAASLTILTVAGNGTPGFGGDGGSPTSAALNNPTRVVADRTGNLYILDTENNRVRKAATDGTITTIAGNGAYGFGGDGGPATGASMEVRGNPTLFPGGIAVDTAGNVYFSDFYNNRVRKISPSGIITTVAGNGSAGFAGDGGIATSASLQLPQGVAIDTAGNLYIADTYNHRVRKIDASGIITTVAGNGGFLPLGDGGPATSAFLSVPTDVAVDAGGNLYIVDHSDSRIRKVDTAGVITTVAGNGSQRNVGDGGSATQASFYGPQGVALDATGNIYIADVGNNRVRIVSIDGTINTEAGTGTGGFAGDEGSPILAQLAAPTGVSVDPWGNILIADCLNNRIRMISSNAVVHK